MTAFCECKDLYTGGPMPPLSLTCPKCHRVYKPIEVRPEKLDEVRRQMESVRPKPLPAPESLVIPSEPRPDRAEQDTLAPRRPLTAGQPRITIGEIKMGPDLVGSDPDPTMVGVFERIRMERQIADRSPPLNTPPAELVDAGQIPLDSTGHPTGPAYRQLLAFDAAQKPIIREKTRDEMMREQERMEYLSGDKSSWSQRFDKLCRRLHLRREQSAKDWHTINMLKAEVNTLKRARLEMGDPLELWRKWGRSVAGEIEDSDLRNAIGKLIRIGVAAQTWLRDQVASIDADLPVAELDEAQLRGVVGVELLRLRRELSAALADAEAERGRIGKLVAERAEMRRELDAARVTNQALAYPGRDEEGRLLAGAGVRPAAVGGFEGSRATVLKIVGGDAEKLREVGLAFQNAVAKAGRERALAIDKALRILAPGQRLAVHEDPATMALEMQYLGVGEQPELGKAWTIYEAPWMARELEFMRAVLANDIEGE